MFKGLKICGIGGSIISTLAVGMEPRAGDLIIYGKNGVEMSGTSLTLPVVADIFDVSYEDFDVTADVAGMGGWQHVSRRSQKEIDSNHLNENIPFLDVTHPHTDYASIKMVPNFITEFLSDKIAPCKTAKANEFFNKIIVRNQQQMARERGAREIQEIPDLDCLFYKDVENEQHLFLRLSSKTRKEAELFKQKANGKNICLEDGDVKIISDKDMTLDHLDIEANNIHCYAQGKILNWASKMKAKWIIEFEADEQRHETIIKKWVRSERKKHSGSHTEGIDSVDECLFKAEKVNQRGRKVDNIGIFVEAETFEDNAVHTTNMPAKITLYNYAWAEKNGFMSTASTEVIKVDDVLVPTRYHVDYFYSNNADEGSSIKLGYTLLNSGSEVIITKDKKEDVVVDEEHTLIIHEEKSGFSICGGVKIPDPTAMLQKMSHSYNSGNMIGFTTSMIGAVAKGIQTLKDYGTLKNLCNTTGPWDLTNAANLLSVISHFVHGPSVQFGHRSVDIKQSMHMGHGNLVRAPKQTYHNKERSTFAGAYIGNDISIKTKTFVTFDIPKTMDYNMSVFQAGLSLDLFSFAVALLNPEIATACGAGLAASSINLSCQSMESHQEVHGPTQILAENLDIEAENGELTQAQIKAGIVHAVFTNDCVLKTLANQSWTSQSGGSISFGLAAFAKGKNITEESAPSDSTSGDVKELANGEAGDASALTGESINFEVLATELKGFVLSTNVSCTDAGRFEKIIDDFASFVGEDEFYLQVGNILRTESAFVGHITHDPANEHIEAAKREEVQVEEYSESWDNSFDLSIPDLVEISEAVKELLKEEVKAGKLTPEEALEVKEATQEFLDKSPEAKKAITETIAAKEKYKKAEERLLKLKEKNPELAEKFEENEAKGILPSEDTLPFIANDTPARVFIERSEYYEASQDFKNARRALYKTVENFSDCIKKFEAEHPNFVKYKGPALKLLSSIVFCVEMWSLSSVKSFNMVFSKFIDKAMDGVISMGVDYCVNLVIKDAKYCAIDEAEAQRFAAAIDNIVQYCKDTNSLLGNVKQGRKTMKSVRINFRKGK